PDSPSFPTRRSSDLRLARFLGTHARHAIRGLGQANHGHVAAPAQLELADRLILLARQGQPELDSFRAGRRRDARLVGETDGARRSEEHASDLQSLAY